MMFAIFVLGRMSTNIFQSLQDGLWYWWWSGQQVAAGLVTILIGNIVHLDVFTFGGDVFVRAMDVTVFITSSLLVNGVGGIQEVVEAISTDIGFQFLDFSMSLFTGSMMFNGGDAGNQGGEKNLCKKIKMIWVLS